MKVEALIFNAIGVFCVVLAVIFTACVLLYRAFRRSGWL